jgi:perosamine synthetase
MSNIEVMPMSFEPGVAPAADMIPLCVPELGGNEWQYVKECLDTNWVSSAGPFVDRFEASVAGYVGARNAVAIVNGTAAIHIALLVAGVQPDDEVIVPALTFVAPANAVRYANAWPVFIDVEPNYWQIDTDKLREFLTNECESGSDGLRNKNTGRKVTAILPVHILGHPCDIDSIMEIAHTFELKVIEDATESLGAEYKGRKVGTGSDFVCFSFNGNKVITTGGGGMVVTNNDDAATRIRYLSTQAKDDPIEYFHENIGFNYRLTNVQAAIGCAQMELLDQYVQKKRTIYANYESAFKSVDGIQLQAQSKDVVSTCWMSTITVDPVKFGRDSRSLMKELGAHRIQSRPLWHPIHSLPPFRSSQAYKVEVADRLYATALSLPSSVGLTEIDQNKVIDKILNAARDKDF